MAKVYLESTDTAFTISNNNTTVFGASGDQVVTVASGVTGVTYDQNTERVVFAGASSAYTYAQSGNQILVYSGGVLVATIPVQGDTNGTQLTFTNGTANAVLTTGVMALGGTTVTTTAATVTPATIDTTVVSPTTTTTTTTGQAFALTSSATADVLPLTSGNDTVTGGAGTVGASDVIVDSVTTDTDVANLTIGASIGAITIKNVETVNLGYDFGGDIDITSISGAKTLNITAATVGNTTAVVKGIASSNATNLVANSDITTLTLHGTTGIADVANLTTKAAAPALTLGATSAIETVGIATSGTASTVTVTNTNAPTTINASGDKNLTIKEASTFAGITINNNMSTGATLTVQSVQTGATDYSKVASSAVLNLSGAINGAMTVNNTQSSVKLSGDANTSGSIVAASGTTNTLNLAVSTTQTNTTTVTGFTTINLTNATTSSATAITLNKGITASTATLNVSGAGDMTLNKAADTGALAAIVATNATGNITAYLGAGTTTGAGTTKFTGGSGNDTIYVPTATAVTIDGGAGTDTISTTTDMTSISFSNVEVVSATGNITKAYASQFSGKTMSLTGAGAGTTFAITSANSNIDSQTIDLSKISVDTTVFSTSGAITVDGNTGTAFTLAMTVTGTNAQDSIVGGSAADYINGGSNTDVLLGNAGADTIVGGEGADTITGAAGDDSIVLTETTPAADTVKITLATDGTDTITGFAADTGADVLSFATTDFVNGTPAATLKTLADVAAFTAGLAAIGANDIFVEITASQAAAGVDTAAEVGTLLSTAATAMTNITTGDKIIVALDDGTDMYLWYWVDSATNAGKVDTAELTLAAKLVGVTDIADADLAIF